jgi:hypothetical protein
MHDEAWEHSHASFGSVRLLLLIRSASPAPAARSFAALPAGYACLLAREFVRRSFLVRGSTTFRGDCSLRLGIHGGESTRRLPAHRSAAPYSFTYYAVTADVVAAPPAGAIAAARDAVAIQGSVDVASLFHKIAPVVGLVCHFNLLPR